MRKTFILVAALLSVLACNAQVVDFEDLNLDENSSWMGEAGVDGFSSSYLTLYNEYDEMYNSFQGFAYTNVTDVETYSYTSIASSSSNNDGNYVTAFVGSNWMDGSYDPIPVSVKIDRSAAPSFENRGAYFCLTTYTSMYMDDAQFGGNYAANQFYFNLQISAYAEGSLVDSREVVMADFSNGNSYKMTDWTFVDLSWINAADSLTFIILSDDSGDYGINTPAYFCMDNFGAENNGETPVNQFVNTNTSLNAFVDNCGNLVVSADDVIGCVSVYDLSGRLVASVDVNANYAILPFDYKGMFVVSAMTSKTCMTAKVVR